MLLNLQPGVTRDLSYADQNPEQKDVSYCSNTNDNTNMGERKERQRDYQARNACMQVDPFASSVNDIN